MTLSGKDFDVITSRIMFKSDWKLALNWLESQGYKIKKTDYYRILNRLDHDAGKRLYEIAQKFEVIAADEIEKFRSLEKMLYEEYHQEQSHINKARILKMIVEIQPYITSLYDEIKTIFEEPIGKQIKKDSVLSKFDER